MNDEEYRANQVVKLSLEDGRIQVEPDPARILLGGTVTWAINGSPKDKVDITFDAGGPFRHRPLYQPNPERGHFKACEGAAAIDSGIAEQQGKFKYTVKWVVGQETVQLDPEVMIKEN